MLQVTQDILQEPVDPQDFDDTQVIEMNEGEPSPAAVLPVDVAEKRAAKYSFALDNEISQEELFDSFNTGTEMSVRQRVALEESRKFAQTSKELIAEVVETKPVNEPITDQELFAIESIANTDLVENPNTVLEKKYGEKLADRGLVQKKNELVLEALNKQPQESNVWVDLAKETIAKKEIVQKRLEELEAAYDNLSTAGKVIDFAENFVPFFTWTNIGGVLDEANTGIKLPGNTIRQKVEFLYTLPPDKFEELFNKAISDVQEENINDAMFFAQAVASFSTTEQFFENTFGVFDLTVIPGVAGAAFRKLSKIRLRRNAKNVEASKETIKNIEANQSSASPLDSIDLKDLNEQETILVKYENYSDWVRDLQKDGVDVVKKGVETDLITKDMFDRKRKKLIAKLTTDPDDVFDEATAVVKETEATPSDQVAATMRDTVKAAGTRETKAEDFLAATGDVEQAAFEKVKADIYKNMRQGTEDISMNELMKQTPSIHSPDTIFNRPYKLAREKEERIRTNLTINATDLLNSLVRVQQISRVQGLELEEALVIANRDFNVRYPHIEEYVLDVKPAHLPAEDVPFNVDRIEIRIGDKNKELFSNPQDAVRYGEQVYELKDFSPRNQGNGWYISIVRNIDETKPAAQQLRLESRGTAPTDIISQFMGNLRTTEETLGRKTSSDRLVATYGGQELLRLQANVAKNIGRVTRQEHTDLHDYLRRQRDWEHPTTGERGRFDRTIAEFEINFESEIGKYPSDKQVQAYFSFIQLSDLDYIVRNLSAYRDKAIQGIENWNFKQVVRDDKTGQLVTKDSGLIEGKVIDEIPWSNPEDAGIAIMHPKTGEVQFFRKNPVDVAQDDIRTNIENLVGSEGYKVIQLTEQGEKIVRRSNNLYLEGVGDEKINFLVVQGASPRALKLKQIPYKAGYHVEYPDGHFVRQGKVSRIDRGEGKTLHRYDGDTHILYFARKSEAEKFSARMDEARLMLKADDPSLGDFLQKNLPWNVNEFRKLFEEQELPNGTIVPPRLHIDDPILSSANGETLADRFNFADPKYGYSNFENSTRSGYNLYNTANLKFMQSRDPTLDTIVTEGTAEAPIFNLRKSDLVDPFMVMNRSARSLTNNRLFDDLKINAARDFIHQFNDILEPAFKGETLEDLMRDPLNVLFERPFKDKINDRSKLAAARNMRRATKELLGLKTDVQKSVDFVKHSLVDKVFKLRGKDGVITSKLEWALEKDPAKFLRAGGFHEKLGLFNPVQYFLQWQTFTHVASLAGPVTASKSLPGVWYSRIRLGLNHSDSMLAEMDKRMVKFGWKPGEFTESHNAMRTTGIYNVGGEVAFRDDVIDSKLIKTPAGNFLEKGTFFFKEAERQARLAGWHTAYLEWRKANPKAVFNRDAQQQVLQRADLFTVNMTRASNAQWQRGLLSVPTQFFAYQARLMEQLVGKRLTTKEKARAFLLYSAMYGMPVGIGGTAFGVWPWYEEIRQGLLERGTQYEDNAVKKMFLEGLPSMILQSVTGTNFNFEERYGPGGLSFFKEMTQGDKDWFDILMGVSGTVIGGFIKSAEPFAHSLLSIFNEDEYPLKQEDFIDAMREISSVNQAVNMWRGLSMGVYSSKNEVNITEVSPIQAIFMGFSGLTPQRVPNAFLKKDAIDDLKQLQKDQAKLIIKNIRRGIYAEDDKERDDWFKRAAAHLRMGNFTPAEYNRIWQQAAEELPLDISVGLQFNEKMQKPEVFQQFIEQIDQQRKELGKD